MPGFRQRFFRQNSLYQDSPKFNNAKVSGFTVHVFKAITAASCVDIIVNKRLNKYN